MIDTESHVLLLHATPRTAGLKIFIGLFILDSERRNYSTLLWNFGAQQLFLNNLIICDVIHCTV